MSDDVLANIRGNKKGRSRPQLADPMQNVTQAEVNKTTVKDSRRAGQYVRMTYTFYPDQIDEFEDIAQRLGVSRMELARWFFDLGIKAVNEGQRPQYETSQQKRIVRETN